MMTANDHLGTSYMKELDLTWAMLIEYFFSVNNNDISNV